MAHNVVTHHYDNGRTGWNRREPQLTPRAVAGPNFGYLFKYDNTSIDNIMYAQPLYLEALVISAVPTNVVFVATESATVYAFDADNFRPGSSPWVWKRSLVRGQEIASPESGLKATPVIDPGTKIMYVVGRFQDAKSGNLYFRLHAIDVRTGNDVMPAIEIDRNTFPPVSGFGEPQVDPATPGQVYFDPAMHFNRPALLLANRRVYVAFGSTGDKPPYHGWVMAFQAADLRPIGVFCTTPEGAGTFNCCYNDPDLGGGIWQAGFGLAADDDGFIYCMTANGIFGSFDGRPARNYADSLLKLTPDVTLAGSFTPQDPAALAAQDLDFGSAGPLVLPDGSGGGKFVIGCGKDANVYLVDRAELTPTNLNQVGNFRSTTRLVSNPGPTAPRCGSGPGVWGGPAYYGGPLGQLVYYCGDQGPLQALVLKMNEKICHNWQKTPSGAWNGETALGGSSKQIAVGVNKNGTLEVFYIGLGDKIYHNWQTAPSGGWYGETALGGSARQVAVALNKRGTLEIFYIGTDAKIYHNWQMTPSGAWYGETPLGGSARQITVGVNQNGTLEIFYIGTDEKIYHNWQTTPSGGWYGETPLPCGSGLRNDGVPCGATVNGNTVVGAARQITVAVNLNGTLEVFYIGTDYKIYHNWQNAPSGSWYGETHGETVLGGSAVQITAAINKNGTLEVFYVGTDDKIYHNWQIAPSGAWNGEAMLGGSSKYIAVAVNKNGTIEIFYVGMDDTIYHNWQMAPSGGWNGETPLGGSAKQIAVAINKNGTLEVFYADGALTQAFTAAGVPNQTPQTEAFPSEGGVIPIVTSDDSVGGTAVVWVITRPDAAGMLHLRAYDAADLTKGHVFEDAVGGWSGGGAFLVPMVVNGKAYVASDRQLKVYGIV